MAEQGLVEVFGTFSASWLGVPLRTPSGAIGVMTTHDLTLAAEEPLATSATLAHFTEQVHADGSMTFDYRLRPGLATSTNALRLMQLIGIAPR